MKDIKAIGDQLVNLTVKEVQELTVYLKETYGIVPASTGVVTKYIAPGDGDYTPAEKSRFEIVLKSAGVNKLQVIKSVKDIFGFGLKEAKDLVDGAPKVLKIDVPKDEAESIKNQLQNIGADVEVK